MCYLQSFTNHTDHSSLHFYRKIFCEMMLYADGLIQEIVDSVEAKGISDNTVFVLLSDNGGVFSVCRFRT